MATAIESMTGISISSNFFSNMPTLEFFPVRPKSPKENRVALIYGKNGSGKSTIAQGFREYRDSVIPRTVTLNPLNGTTSIKISPPGKPEKFYVFDETYILSRVRVRDSGLDAIVLFGEQVSLDEQIAEIEKNLVAKKQEISVQEDECNRFQNIKDVTSPDYWRVKIADTLKSKDGWADIGSKIKRQKVKLSVSDSEISRIGGLSPQKTLDQLKQEFDKLYTRFLLIDANTTPLLSNTFHLPDITSVEKQASSLLSQIIDRPKLTARELKILELFNLSNVAEAKSYLSNESNSICAKCYQPISADYRVEALEGIDRILNREVEEFKGRLTNILLPEASEEMFSSYIELSTFKTLCSKLKSYNTSVCSHNATVQAKIDDPFSPLNYDASVIGLISAAENFSGALADLDKEIADFNHVVNDLSETQKKLLHLNDCIAHYCVEADYAALRAQQDAKNTAVEKKKKLLADQTLLEQNKAKLDLQRKNYRIAADEINDSLKYIFFSDKRVTIELGDDQLYHLKSNGATVNPSKVSCGERNAIALCYYFTEIAKNMDAKNKYADELFLVIDDPISSFDIENRIGILSFLRWKLEQVLDGCPTTKILLMTHDVSVIFDCEKALGEITEHCAQNSHHAEFKVFQLEDKSLHNFEKNHNEYTHLLQMVYQYAKADNPDEDLSLVIGNVMRRVLETFTSFSFKKGIDDVRLKDKYLALLPDDATRTYYQNLMYRLVLNTESHGLEGVKAAPETSFWSHLSSSEKQRTAKDILCFINCLNSTHLLSHLPEAETDLKTWSSAIKKTAGSNLKT